LKPRIDVCVATYKRPALLERLLRSLVQQETAEEFSVAIVVADNDAGRSGEAMVRSFAAAGHDVIYGVEPEQSVSLARNKSVSLATGDYIATTDDDLYVDRLWLRNLYRALTAYDADVVHGPVIPEFEPGTRSFIRECPVFNRPNPATGSTGNYFFTTANSLFRRELIDGLTTPFDPRFGRSGGEDSAFFNSLRQRGARMTWCREAVVFGPVPPARARLRWVLKRRFRYGYMHPINGAHAVDRVVLGSTAKEMATLSLAASRSIAGSIFDRSRRDEGMKSVVAMLLHVAFLLGILAHYGGLRYEEYRPK
jgi:succinoglycan biosynthesis protein ExoM